MVSVTASTTAIAIASASFPTSNVPMCQSKTL